MSLQVLHLPPCELLLVPVVKGLSQDYGGLGPLMGENHPALFKSKEPPGAFAVLKEIETGGPEPHGLILERLLSSDFLTRS